MKRREFTASVIVRAGAVALALLEARGAWAAAGAGVSESDAAGGVRAALEKGAATAVATLGRPGGFASNPKVRIPLPGYLEQASRVLKMTGQGRQLDELVTAMNQAAEAAVPLAKPMLVQAVKSMSVDDALQIVRGGNTSATQYFAGKTRAPLTAEFLPVVTKQTERVGLAQRYNDVAGKVSSMGLIKASDANIQRYVTGKALDGLYLMIGEEEAKIRADPWGSGSALLKKVFG